MGRGELIRRIEERKRERDLYSRRIGIGAATIRESRGDDGKAETLREVAEG